MQATCVVNCLGYYNISVIWWYCKNYQKNTEKVSLFLKETFTKK